ncbi:MAG: radical SAM protein, partial [Clostridiales bacterium]|nr:radical SAM protein [Clostridiales bacterium]
QVAKDPKVMSRETLAKALDWISENVSDPFVSFFGGEPILEFEAIKWAIATYPNIKFGLSTNLTLLTPDKIQFFLENKTRFLFSIDGFGDIHNITRDDSWDKFSHLLPILGELFPKAVFRITITPENVSHLYETVSLGSQLGFQNFNALPNGISEQWKTKDYLELKNQLTMIYNNPILRNSFRPFQDYRARLDGIGDYECCDAKTTIGITTDGRFTLCGEQTEDNIFIVGDLDTGIIQEKVDAFHELIVPCPINCKANPICSKERCFSRRFFCNGDISKRIKNHCRWYNIMEEVLASDNL